MPWSAINDFSYMVGSLWQLLSVALGLPLGMLIVLALFDLLDIRRWRTGG